MCPIWSLLKTVTVTNKNPFGGFLLCLIRLIQSNHTIIFTNSSSVRIVTPSSRALSSFEPASSPATTYDVFFETELETSPPFARTIAWAVSRSRFFILPVNTKDLPSRGRASLVCSTMMVIFFKISFTNFLFSLLANQSTNDCATTSPTP